MRTLEDFLKHGKKGNEYTYHRGFLLMGNLTAAAVDARKAAAQGIVSLVQRRIGVSDFEYVMQHRGGPTERFAAGKAGFELAQSLVGKAGVGSTRPYGHGSTSLRRKLDVPRIGAI